MVPCNSYKSLCFFLLVAYGVLQAEAGPNTTPKSIYPIIVRGSLSIVTNASTNNTGINKTIATTYANPSMTHIRLSTTMAAYSSATHIRSSTTKSTNASATMSANANATSANANATSANANATSANANATSANANATSANASATHARPSATSINRNGSMTHTITNRTATHMATSSGTTSHHSKIPTPSKSPGKGDDKDYNSMKKRMWAAASFAIIFAITTVVLGYLAYRQRKINRELEGDPSTSRLL